MVISVSCLVSRSLIITIRKPHSLNIQIPNYKQLNEVLKFWNINLVNAEESKVDIIMRVLQINDFVLVSNNSPSSVFAMVTACMLS